MLKITPILDWFIPDKYTKNSKQQRQVRLWVGIVFLFLAYSFLAIIQGLVFNIHDMAIALAIGSVLATVLLFLLKGGVEFKVLMHIGLIGTLANIGFGVYTTGGVMSVVCMWLIIVPLVALMLSDLKNTIPYLIGVPVILTFVYWIQTTGHTLPQSIPQANLPGANLTAFTGFLFVLFLVVFTYDRANNKLIALLETEKNKSDSLLLNILPYEVAEELKSKGYADAKHFDVVTVLFTDFKDFTAISEKLTPQELVKEIHDCFKAFDDICSKHGIEKIKTIGDAYMAAGGLPQVNQTNAVDVVQAGIEIRDFMLAEKKKRGAHGFEIRIGIHTGPVVAGIVGVRKFAYDIWGDTVNTAARMEQNGEAGKVNISAATYELVKDRFACTYRGKITAKNKGEIDMYFLD